ncbi:MAG: chloride channel protein [Nitrospinae bacterium]|nr:chloride channel protein [Nitrospinota bacterium]
MPLTVARAIPATLLEAVRRVVSSAARFLRQEHIFIILVACAVGYAVGVVIFCFKWMISSAHSLFYGQLMAHAKRGLTWEALWVPFVVGLGGLIVGLMNHFLNPRKNSGSVSEPMRWAAVDQGRAPASEILFRPVASAITIGSGGSAGREGPAIVIGSAVGSFMGSILKSSSERRRLLLGCGSAAGMAAAFNAPLGGIMFAIEVILGDFNINVFSPLIFSSVISTVTVRQLEGNQPAFTMPAYALASGFEMFFFAVLGIAGGLVAALFFKVYFACSDYFSRRKLHAALAPTLGGVLVGFVGIFFPETLGNGYDSMESALHGDLVWQLALGLIFVKILATSVTLGSGGSGGLFAPSLFIGSMLGMTLGSGFHYLFPAHTGTPASYAIVGMGAVMAVVGNMPLTNILMTFELTNNYQIILPIMIACISSVSAYSYFFKQSIYAEKLRRLGVTIWRGRESSIMASIKVADVMNRSFEVIRESAGFKEVVERVTKSKAYFFPCADETGVMTGIISVQDLREFMLDEGLAHVVVAKDLATHEVITLSPQDDLNVAMEKFAIKDLEELPVTDGAANPRVVGMLKRKDAIAAYQKASIRASEGRPAAVR